MIYNLFFFHNVGSHSEKENNSIFEINNTDLAQQQKTCPEIGKIYEYIAKDRPESLKIHFSEKMYRDLHFFFITKEGILVRLDTRTFRQDIDLSKIFTQIIIPRNLRYDILVECHDKMFHPAKFITFKNVISRYYWPKVLTQVENFVDTCLVCQKALKQKSNRVPMNIFSRSTLFQTWAMDIKGSLIKSEGGNSYLTPSRVMTKTVICY